MGWPDAYDCVSFPAAVDERQIRCLISWEALQDNFGGNGVQPLDCFCLNRNRIEEKAERFIAQGRFEADGSILIRSQDGA
ncbi:DUF1488 domain-containing protein [Niveibacterium sp.]|uniref:DUF1488 domain-containing protein n=1 Tax=Niveibacterium sp. TaxID=2017444 RepID=UPI0035B21A22